MRRILQSSTAVLLGASVLASAAARPLDGDAAVEDAILATTKGSPIGFEDEALYLASDVASRKGDVLTLRFASGVARRYTSTPRCDPNKAQPECVKYTLAAYLRTRNVFVVARLQAADTSFLIVDAKTGGETALSAPPVFSPNGALLAEYDPNATSAPPVRLLRRHGGTFVPEWAGALNDGRSVATFEALKWRSNGAIAFKKSVWKRSSDPTFSSSLSNILPTQVEAMIELRRTKAGWSVSAEVPLPQPRRPSRWNWRTVWVSSNEKPPEPCNELRGVADVVFGRHTIKITDESSLLSLTGRINASGDIRGAASSPDGGAVLMIGRYDEAPLFPAGRKPDCSIQEIQLRAGATDGKPFPNGSVTILVNQLQEECVRGLPSSGD